MRDQLPVGEESSTRSVLFIWLRSFIQASHPCLKVREIILLSGGIIHFDMSLILKGT